MDYSVLDVVVVILITLLGLKGLLQGLVKEVFGLLGIVGGVFVASRFSSEVAEQVMVVAPFIKSESGAQLAGFAVAFLVFWLGMIALGTLTKKLLSMSGLGFFDRLGGAVVGSAKIFFIFAIVAYAMGSVEFISKKLEPKVANSFMYPILFETGSFIMKMDSNPALESVNRVREEMANGVKEIASDAIDEAISGGDVVKDLSDEQLQAIKEKAKEMSPEDIEAIKEKVKEMSPEDLEKLLENKKSDGSL